MGKSVKCSSRTITSAGVKDVEFEIDFDDLGKFLTSIGTIEPSQSIKDGLSTDNYAIAHLQHPINSILLSMSDGKGKTDAKESDKAEPLPQKLSEIRDLLIRTFGRAAFEGAMHNDNYDFNLGLAGWQALCLMSGMTAAQVLDSTGDLMYYVDELLLYYQPEQRRFSHHSFDLIRERTRLGLGIDGSM